MTTIYATRHPDREWVTVTFRYDPEIVDTIKAVPSNYRSYNPEQKSWTIFDRGFFTRFAHAAERLGHTIDIDDPEPPKPTDTADPDGLERTFTDLFQQLPEPLRRPVKTALLGAIHPDKGGDHLTCVALNAALARTK